MLTFRNDMAIPVLVSLRISGRLTPLKGTDFLDGHQFEFCQVKARFLDAQFFLQDTILVTQSRSVKVKWQIRKALILAYLGVRSLIL